MKSLLVLLMLFLSFGVVRKGQAAEVQELSVSDFRGGLVNSVANAVMDPNQAKVLENFDITPYGGLRPRLGRTLIASDTLPYTVEQLAGYWGLKHRQLVELRTQKSSQVNDTAARYTDALTFWTPGGGICSTNLYDGLYNLRRSAASYSNFDWSLLVRTLVIAQAKSELLLYNDSIVYPARPLGPGQPRAIAIDGGGKLNGTFRYKYCYWNTTADDTSNFSSPSWPVKVDYGKVYLWDMWADPDQTADSIIVYRQKNDGKYEKLVVLPDTLSYWLDTLAATATADTTGYAWGNCPTCAEQAPACSTLVRRSPPGTFTVTIDSCTTAGWGVGDTLATAGYCCWPLQYAIQFVDINGTGSLWSPPVCIRIHDTVDHNWKYKIRLNGLPVPRDSGIVRKRILRMHPTDNPCYALGVTAPSFVNNWYVIDSVDAADTTYTDSMSASTNYTDSNLMCQYGAGSRKSSYTSGGIIVYTTTGVDTIYGDEPENDCCAPDSTIIFRPLSAISHGSRVFAIGNPDYPHRLYYSDFGYPAKWPTDKFIDIPSRRGDWPVKLLEISDNDMLIFRQNSIAALSGLSFFQYRLQEVIAGVGLTAPRSVAAAPGVAYFAHTSGIYLYPSLAQPISIPIDSSLDSLTLANGVGRLVGRDYWFSTGTKTFIYSLTPAPHWKVYSFPISDVLAFNVDSTVTDYQTTRWLVLSNDSLWSFGQADTLDDTAAITCTYESKFFFDGNGRERIYYVDLYGEGNADTVTVSLMCDSNEVCKGVTQVVDFSDGQLDRFVFDVIAERAAIKITAKHKNYILRGYSIGWLPIDKGKL